MKRNTMSVKDWLLKTPETKSSRADRITAGLKP